MLIMLATAAAAIEPHATTVLGDAIQVFSMNAPPLDGALRGDGYGSAMSGVPGSTDEVYGLTDRGPNVFLGDGTFIEPLPNFQPRIGKFRLRDGEAILEQVIPLTDSAGHPYSGRVNSENPRGQRIVDLDRVEQAPDPNGYDPEGLVALPDGSFWISDEYGPFIVHVDAAGRQISRLSPLDGSLPRELANRIGNRGLEGLAITPDGSTLVAIMQSALQQPDLGGADPITVGIVRIVTYGLGTSELHECLYVLDDPATKHTGVSEIATLPDGTFLVDERDAKFPPGAYKRLWRIDLRNATDVGPNQAVAGAVYDPGRGGLLINGRTLEALVAGQDSATVIRTLRSHGIEPVSKTLALDLGGLLDQLDPRGGLFAHDKVEGLYVDAKRRRLLISNDNDFGIAGLENPTPPCRLSVKRCPATGRQDAGEFLVIDVTRLPPGDFKYDGRW
jgi:hypothetical protein